MIPCESELPSTRIPLSRDKIMNLDNLVQALEQKKDLDSEQMEQVISAMMDGAVAEDDMARFLLCLKEKGESVDELVGAAKAMRNKMGRIHSTQTDLVDTCGTGGDGSGTFNISTAAAIVASSAGIAIAKHGNRAISSKSGSADALRELGVNVDASQPQVEKCLSGIGLCFCFAPLFHGSVKNVGAARKKLGVPTIFNMLGPLCNPAGADYQILGVGQPWQRPLIASAVQKLGCKRAVVLHGRDQICEISNAEETDVSIVNADSIEEAVWSPEQFGIHRSSREGILAANPGDSARLIREALSGRSGPARDIVVLNAAAAIWIKDPTQPLKRCAEICMQKIDGGEALAMLGRLVEMSNER